MWTHKQQVISVFILVKISFFAFFARFHCTAKQNLLIEDTFSFITKLLYMALHECTTFLRGTWSHII